MLVSGMIYMISEIAYIRQLRSFPYSAVDSLAFFVYKQFCRHKISDIQVRGTDVEKVEIQRQFSSENVITTHFVLYDTRDE